MLTLCQIVLAFIAGWQFHAALTQIKQAKKSDSLWKN